MHTLLCLVRHGATDWNFDMRAQGHFDQPLNDEGRRQAQRVAERLGAERWDAIYSSDLSRTRDTAAAIAARAGLPVHLDPGLRERNMGSVEGMTLRDRRMRYGTVDWRELPGVETDSELRQRAAETLGRIAAQNMGKRVVCVSHGGTLSAFIGLITDGKLRKMHRNTSVTLVRWDGRDFTPELTACHTHILEPSGLEYSGERGRVTPVVLRDLYASCGMSESEWPEDRLASLVELSPAAWAAWEGDRLVGFARGITDAVSSGVIDRCAVHPDWRGQGVLADLVSRVKARFPLVEWTER